VAITLLLLELRVPAKETIHSEAALRRALATLPPQLVVYLMSFLTLGIFWVGQQTQLNHLARSDRDLTRIHLAFLFAVTLRPFRRGCWSILTRPAPRCWHTGRTFLLLGAVLFFGAGGYATRAGLVKGEIPPDVPAAISRRILSAQSLYAFGAVPVRGQHVLEHRVCRARATQLCDRFRSEGRRNELRGDAPGSP